MHGAITLLALLMMQDKAPATCPVEITAPRHHHHLPFGTDVTVSYTNKTSKTIKGAKFGIVLYDEAGDPHDYVYYVAGMWDTDPGKKGRGDALLQTVTLRDGQRKDSRNGMQFYLIKALFDDGTTWSDDGAKQCVSPID
jgi:hypothetical protein